MNLGNALIEMYAKCGEIHTARQVFDELSSLDVVFVECADLQIF
jgi:pentatricopeptide repeat protein